MKKCLFISSRDSVFTEPVLRALSRAGLEARFVDFRGHALLRPGSILRRVTGKLPHSVRTALFQRAQKSADRRILSAARSFRPDVVLASKAKEVSEETLSELRRIAVTANWYTETLDHWEGIRSVAHWYDHFFSFDRGVIDRLAAEGYDSAHYLPFCADAAAGSMEHPRPIPISFVGTYHTQARADRIAVLKCVADLGLSVWGNGGWQYSPLQDNYRGKISTEGMLDTYRLSRIVINQYMSSAIPGSGINIRPFQATANGAMLLNDDARADIFQLFDAGKEFIPYHDAEDAREKAQYYLRNERERFAIAEAGYKRLCRDHTYDRRIAELLRVIL